MKKIIKKTSKIETHIIGTGGEQGKGRKWGSCQSNSDLSFLGNNNKRSFPRFYHNRKSTLLPEEQATETKKDDYLCRMIENGRANERTNERTNKRMNE